MNVTLLFYYQHQKGQLPLRPGLTALKRFEADVMAKGLALEIDLLAGGICEVASRLERIAQRGDGKHAAAARHEIAGLVHGVPAWYTVTLSMASASSTPVMTLPFSYDPGYPALVSTTATAHSSRHASSISSKRLLSAGEHGPRPDRSQGAAG